jgi:DNA-binding LytR/AlgR family response regulator
LALWLATGRGGRPPLVLSAIVLGIAVSGMHYTAMAGLTLLPFAAPTASAPALSSDLLATVVAVVAFCLSGIFLLILVPEPEKPLQSAALGETAASGEHVVTAGAPRQTAEMPVMAQAPHGNGLDANPEFGRGTYSPLGGIGAPPRRFARHLPIERDGSTHFLAVEEVVAIHANAHYTYIFNGSDKLFCPLAIGDVESRLDNTRFVRIHRSHIVNIDRVVGYKRSGDNELVEMDATHDYVVPVSRSRIGRLKTRVAALTGDSPAVALRRRQHFASQ